MKQKLPSQAGVIVLFPRNLRLISEYSFTKAQSNLIKIILTSIVSLFLLGLIFLQGVVIWDNFNEQRLLSQQRMQVENEVKYWEGIANKYQGYRDVYYRIGALQYKLGNTTESQKYIKKALDLDPNFPQGHVLGAQVGL